jgi:hypothetical protein
MSNKRLEPEKSSEISLSGTMVLFGMLEIDLNESNINQDMLTVKKKF